MSGIAGGFIEKWLKQGSDVGPNSSPLAGGLRGSYPGKGVFFPSCRYEHRVGISCRKIGGLLFLRWLRIWFFGRWRYVRFCWRFGCLGRFRCIRWRYRRRSWRHRRTGWRRRPWRFCRRLGRASWRQRRGRDKQRTQRGARRAGVGASGQCRLRRSGRN